MSKVAPGKKQHKSLRGKNVDMELLRKRNELTPAVGNARVNARGDELGPNGTILRKREEIVADHYSTAGTAIHAEAPEPLAPVAEDVPATVTKKTTKKSVQLSRQSHTTLPAGRGTKGGALQLSFLCEVAETI